MPVVCHNFSNVPTEYLIEKKTDVILSAVLISVKNGMWICISTIE